MEKVTIKRIARTKRLQILQAVLKKYEAENRTRFPKIAGFLCLDIAREANGLEQCDVMKLFPELRKQRPADLHKDFTVFFGGCSDVNSDTRTIRINALKKCIKELQNG